MQMTGALVLEDYRIAFSAEQFPEGIDHGFYRLWKEAAFINYICSSNRSRNASEW